MTGLQRDMVNLAAALLVAEDPSAVLEKALQKVRWADAQTAK